MLLEYLEQNKGYVSNIKEMTCKISGKPFSVDLPIVDREVYKIRELLQKHGLYDRNYLGNTKTIGNKPIEEMTASETMTMLTYPFAFERFHDGLVRQCLENGFIKNLLKHFLELCEKQIGGE